MSVLSVRAFRRMVASWALSNFGDSVLLLSLAIWVKDLTGRNSATGLVFLFLGLPALFAPLTGQLADRMSRRRLVVIANVVAAVGVTALWFVNDESHLWIIYAVSFGYGLLGYTMGAAGSGLVRDALDDDQLAAGNGLLNTIDQGARLLSPLVGAGVYAAFGGPAVAAVTATCLVLAAAVMSTVSLRESPPDTERSGFIRKATAGFRHLRSVLPLARMALALAVAFAVTGIANTTMFAIIEESLGRSATFFGLLAAAQGAGSLLGGGASGRLIKRFGESRVVATGLALLGAGLAAMVIPFVAAVLAASFVVGLAVPCIVVGFVTLRQRLTPYQLQGRAAAATMMALNGPQTIGIAAGAALIAVVDYRILTLAMSAGILACVPVIVASERPGAIRAGRRAVRNVGSFRRRHPPSVGRRLRSDGWRR